MSNLKSFYLGSVNPPIYQASTLVFDNLSELAKAKKLYGRGGTATNDVLAAEIAKLEKAEKSIIVSSGVSAISSVLLSLLKQNDHMLVCKSAYEPTRDLCNGVLNNFGVKTDYFTGNATKTDVESLITEKTKIIFLESPASISFEIQDLAEIVKLAKKHNILTIIDNTWSAGYFLKPLDLGIDISIQSLSKYVSGHSDILLGSISFKNIKLFEEVWPNFYQLGDHASPQDCYLAFRGLQTLPIRMKQHEASALKLANLLEKNSKIAKVIYPALSSSTEYARFKKYFTGSNGLISIVFKDEISELEVKKFIDNLHYFKLGYSWGGYDSLVMYYKETKLRKAIVRLSIGLEDIDVLSSDLANALAKIC